ncbi:MAG: hypothetical protein H0U18_17815 [Pyrinomonadaceae bacterium]|nr:hypothetical protein [Pyrinomonadaceae bacterium]
MRKYLKSILFGIVLLGLVASAVGLYGKAGSVSARAVSEAAVDDKRYSTDMNELRTKFNRDRGKVRLLKLLSPT